MFGSMVSGVAKGATDGKIMGGILGGGSGKAFDPTVGDYTNYDPTKKGLGAKNFAEGARFKAYEAYLAKQGSAVGGDASVTKTVKTVKTAGISQPTKNPSGLAPTYGVAPANTTTANTTTANTTTANTTTGTATYGNHKVTVVDGKEYINVPYAGRIEVPSGTASSKPLSAEEELQAMYKAQLTDYQQYQKPIIDELTKEAESNAIVRLGNIQSDALGQRVRGQTERSMGMDASRLLPSQKAALDSRMSNDIRLSQGGINRSAQIAQQEHNTATRTNLMSIAESLQTTGVAGVGSAAKAQAERDAAAAKAKGGMMSQVLSIAGGVVGGIYGGPMGAQAGAALGGMAGGAMGG